MPLNNYTLHSVLGVYGACRCYERKRYLYTISEGIASIACRYDANATISDVMIAFVSAI